MATTLATLIQQFQQQQESARQANLKRYAEAQKLYDEIIKRYQPGGEFGKGAISQYERGKVRSLASAAQNLVSSGLYGTSVTAGLGKKYEEEVGTPFRLQLEDIRMGRLSEAERGKAGLIERREDIGPDPALIAQLAMQATSAPRTVSYTQSSKGPSPWEKDFMGGGWSLSGGVTTSAQRQAQSDAAMRAAGWVKTSRGWQRAPTTYSRMQTKTSYPQFPSGGAGLTKQYIPGGPQPGTYYGAAYKPPTAATAIPTTPKPKTIYTTAKPKVTPTVSKPKSFWGSVWGKVSSYAKKIFGR